MRELDIGTKKHTVIEIGAMHPKFDVSHDYYVYPAEGGRGIGFEFAKIHFQQGPVKENGVNGIHNEDLLAIVIDRLRSFQMGPYLCMENHIALHCLELAMQELTARTDRRTEEGVEGTSGFDETVQRKNAKTTDELGKLAGRLADPNYAAARQAQAKPDPTRRQTTPMERQPTPTGPGTPPVIRDRTQEKLDRQVHESQVATHRSRGQQMIEAHQWLPYAYPPKTAIDGITPDGDRGLFINIHGNPMYVTPGVWVIRERDGVHWRLCEDGIFHGTYESLLDGRN